MDKPEPVSASESTSSPKKISVPRLLEFEFKRDISYEDVLAARVFQKTLRAQAYVFGLVVVLLAYVGFDLKGKSNALRADQDLLAAQQKELTTQQKQFHQDMDDARERMVEYEAQIRERVGAANGLVTTAGEVVKSADAYQGALAGHLVRVGEMENESHDLQVATENATRQLSTGFGQLQQGLSNLGIQQHQDSLTLSATLSDVRGLAKGISSTNRQVVEEDSPTPIGNSGFTLEFDDLKANECMITGVKLKYNRTNVPGWPRDRVMVGVPTPVTVDGHRYLLTITEGFSRRGKVFFFMVTSRVLVELRNLDDLTENSADVQHDETMVGCQPVPHQ